MHLLLSIATLAAATTEDSSTCSGSSCNLRDASSTHPTTARTIAFLPSSMRSSPTTSTMIHEYNDEPTPHSLLRQSYEPGGVGPLPNEPSINSMDCSVFFMDEILVQQEEEQEQSHPSTSSCSPNEERMCYMGVVESTPMPPPLPILPLGWVLAGRDSKEEDDRDRALISSQSASPQTTRTTGRTTTADDRGGARTFRPERTTTTVTAGRYQQGHDFAQQQQQQSSPTHRLSFMVSNSLLWMVSMVRNAVLA
jgi:hypothetical protein